MRNVRDLVLEMRSDIFFIVSFIAMVLGMVIMKQEITKAMIVISILLVIVYTIRMINRGLKLHNGIYFLEDVNFALDAQKRADQWGDAAAVLVYFLLVFSANENLFNKFGNSVGGIVFLSIMFFVPIAGVSISKNYICLKMVTILMSTIQGMFFVLIMLVDVLGFLTNGQHFIQNFFNAEQIISICFMVETSLNEYIPIVIGGILINILYITFTPPYQLDKLGFAYKIVNLICILISTIVFWKANISINDIKSYIQNAVNSEEVMRWQEYKEYLASFSKTNITNTIYIVLLPYTFSIVCNGLYIEILKRRYEKKCRRYFDLLLNHNESYENMDVWMRYYQYYGGEKYKISILNKLVEFREKREDNLINEEYSDKNSDKKLPVYFK